MINLTCLRRLNFSVLFIIWQKGKKQLSNWWDISIIKRNFWSPTKYWSIKSCMAWDFPGSALKRPHASTAGGMDWIPAQGTKDPWCHVTATKQINKQNQKSWMAHKNLCFYLSQWVLRVASLRVARLFMRCVLSNKEVVAFTQMTVGYKLSLLKIFFSMDQENTLTGFFK